MSYGGESFNPWRILWTEGQKGSVLKLILANIIKLHEEKPSQSALHYYGFILRRRFFLLLYKIAG